MTSYVNSYVEKTHLLRPPLGDVRNQPIKRLMAALIYIYIGTAGSLFVCGQKTLSETIGEFWWDYNKQLQKLLGKLLGTIRKIVI